MLNKKVWTARTRVALLASLLVGFTANPGFGAPKAERATGVRLEPGKLRGSARIAVSFTGPPTYSARLEQKGMRLLVDVPHFEVRGALPVFNDPVGVVGGAMVQSFESASGTTTRLLVTLLGPARHSISVVGNDLVVSLEPGAAPEPSRNRQNGSLVPVAEGVLDPTERPAPAADQATTLADLRFDSTSLEDSVRIELRPNKATPEVTRDEGHSRLRLRGVRLPPALERTLDVSAFRGRVRRISTYSSPTDPRDIVIEVEHPDGVEARLTETGSGLVWSFFDPRKLPSSYTGIGADGGIARRSKTVHVETALTDVPEVHAGFMNDTRTEPVERTVPDERASAFTSEIFGQARGFSGRRIDLDLKDADIHNVLRLLADVGRVNVITADNVSGTVTIKMRNVPWDQALDVVLQAKKLGMVRRGNMIRVAPLSDLEKEREMAIARKQQEIKLAPLETRLIPVSYASANDLKARAQPMLSDRGTIAVDERTNVMIARDIVGNLNQIEELVRSLDTQTPQVLVEARIVEATSRYLRDVGIQWGGDATFSAVTGNPTGLAFPNAVGIAGGASDGDTPTAGLSPFSNAVTNPNFAVNLPAATGTGQGGAIGLTFGSIDNSLNLALRLSAAEATGMLRVLSSPRVLTLDNYEAKIAQGTMIPFSQVSASGVQTTFQEAKLQLIVKPHVTADGSVSMHVRINRDEPDFNQTSARGDPTILKREAETDLLVMDGHTAVIGGIFTRNTGRNLDQVPFFGDIPLLGLLFQRRRASDQRGELVIFLTPRIVNRAQALGR